MDNLSVENYTEKLLKRLYSLYGEYCSELQLIQTRLDNSSVEVLETFINIEQHRFQQISSIEKVLNTHLQGCSGLFQKNATEKLNIKRLQALKMSREVRISLNSRMKQIRTELSSIRLPGRAKNYRQESVPVLIDIET
jgi:hypothetical protein